MTLHTEMFDNPKVENSDIKPDYLNMSNEEFQKCAENMTNEEYSDYMHERRHKVISGFIDAIILGVKSGEENKEKEF